MEQRIKDIKEYGDKLFSERLTLVSMWQEIANNFYVERADFTNKRTIGADISSHLTTSVPLLARRDLGNSLSSMLRPASKSWFAIKTNREDYEDTSTKRWLEFYSQSLRKAMYDRKANFVRATKEGDHDFVAFGQCVLSVNIDEVNNHLQFNSHHLRDVVWREDSSGAVVEVHRKWNPLVIDLAKKFPGQLSDAANRKLKEEPLSRLEVRHVVKLAVDYDAPKSGKWRFKYISVYFEVEEGKILEEKNLRYFSYVIPRWQTVSGSQYAYSPATIAALPDARLILAMTLTLLEAGEKAVNPPLVLKREVFREDFNMFTGGLTYADLENDERLQDVMQILSADKGALPLGIEMRNDTRAVIQQAFFLDKLNLPPYTGTDMTAFEVSQRIQEYIRNALPLFEPIETEYNYGLCKNAFDIMLTYGGFGSEEDMPDQIKKAISGDEVEFRFENALLESQGREKGIRLQETKGMLAEAVALDPSSAQLIDIKVALRDALHGMGVPAKWIRTEEDMAAIEQEIAAKQQAAEMINLMQQGGAAAEQIGKGGQAMNEMAQVGY